MIQEIAIADAYAQAFEFVKNPSEHGLSNKTVDGALVFQQNPKYKDLKPGDFTDDTVRTIASYWTINYRPWDLTPELYFISIGDAFWAFHRKDWSKRFQEFMENNKDYINDCLDKIVKRDTNGAIMGILPFGLLDSIYEVKTMAAMHAFSTHSASTIPYAQAAALCVYYLRNNKYKNAISGLRNFLLDNVEELSIVKGSPGSMRAIDTFNVVLRQIEKAYERQMSMTELVIDCVDLGGDTDTIAALSAGIYSNSYHYQHSADDFVDKNFNSIERDKPENRKFLAELKKV